jgi:glycosyltransferase involved in cell wall biosynthesis
VKQTDSKPLLLVISQVYVPDPASVGQHVADVAEAMAGRGYDVRVLTSARGYENPQARYPRREQRGGVDVRRLPWSSFGKKSLVHRVIGQSLFLVQVIRHGLFARRLAGILVSTSPPMASFAAVVIGTVRRVPITYWLMDLNPDQLIALCRASSGSVPVRAMRWLNRRIFARAATVIVLDRFMAERVERQYRVGGRLEVLPPWPHEESLADVPRDANPFVAEHQLADRFVVMYSGNHSLASPLATLLTAAQVLRDDPRFVFLFIGGGHGKRVVEQMIAAHRPANIVSLPYQPLERIKFSLSAADLHVVTLGDDMAGIIHPCKIYGAMAVGRPVLFIGPRPSHAAELIERHEIGWQVAHGDVDGAVAALNEIAALPPAARAAIGQRARQAVAVHYSKQALCAAFCDAVERSLVSKQYVPNKTRAPELTTSASTSDSPAA